MSRASDKNQMGFLLLAGLFAFFVSLVAISLKLSGLISTEWHIVTLPIWTFWLLELLGCALLLTASFIKRLGFSIQNRTVQASLPHAKCD